MLWIFDQVHNVKFLIQCVAQRPCLDAWGESAFRGCPAKIVVDCVFGWKTVAIAVGWPPAKKRQSTERVRGRLHGGTTSGQQLGDIFMELSISDFLLKIISFFVDLRRTWKGSWRESCRDDQSKEKSRQWGKWVADGDSEESGLPVEEEVDCYRKPQTIMNPSLPLSEIRVLPLHNLVWSAHCMLTWPSSSRHPSNSPISQIRLSSPPLRSYCWEI